jgi:hypothetical protein
MGRTPRASPIAHYDSHVNRWGAGGLATAWLIGEGTAVRLGEQGPLVRACGAESAKDVDLTSSELRCLLSLAGRLKGSPVWARMASVDR